MVEAKKSQQSACRFNKTVSDTIQVSRRKSYERKKPYKKYDCSVSCFSLSQCLGGITPVISNIAEAFPELSSTSAMYISTIASLTSIPASLAAGSLIGKKIEFKKASLLAILIILIGGCLPTFFPFLPVIFISRGFFGIGMGIITVIGNPLASALFPEEERASVLGKGTIAAFAGAVCMQLLAGVLADIHWNLAFLTHALAAVSLVLVALFLPDVKLKKADDTKTTFTPAASEKIPVRTYMGCILFGVATLIISPLLVGSSLLASALTDKATLMSLVSICYSIGCMMGGSVFGWLYRHAKERCLTFSLIIAATGLLASAYAGSIAFLCVAILIAGIGFGSLMSGIMMLISVTAPVSGVAKATSIMMALSNVFTFFCSGWMNLIGRITGDTTYMPLKIGALLYLVIGIILLIFPIYPKQKNTK
ncbi:MAG: MFS transporter [Clostridiales bacterium]|nr:MFS transporter [Clostridiales bacterium]